MGAAVLELGVAASGCRDASADGLGVLRREGADAACAAMDEERLALLEFGHVEVAHDGGCHLKDACGGHEIDAGRRGNQLALGCDEELGIGATAQERDDLVALLPTSHAFADGFDDSRSLEAEDVGDTLRGWIVAATLQHIGTVDADRDSADEHFPNAGERALDFFDLESIDVAWFMNKDCLHVSRLPHPLGAGP